ncbi:GNAT family N-acetyltransferase [Yoonia sp. SS1-5]|uniref:GNAT family N-acetyltransferase n=1 Tax=Yoonia rhodophyticola TaxID=3137370 RepID=A0AAN0MBU9_9RHOB
MAFEIRRAMTQDAAAFVACIDAAYAPHIDRGLDLPPVGAGIADDIQTHSVWVATQNGVVRGGIVLVLAAAAHIANLAVHPAAGGQGIAKTLIGQAISAARSAGYDRVQLATHAEMTATQAVYLRLGWTEAGRDGNKVYFEYRLNDA